MTDEHDKILLVCWGCAWLERMTITASLPVQCPRCASVDPGMHPATIGQVEHYLRTTRAAALDTGLANPHGKP